MTVLLLAGTTPAKTEAALTKMTIPGYTAWPTLGAWTPPGPMSNLPGAPREVENGTAVLIGGSGLTAQALATVLATLLGEESVAYMELPEMRLS